MMKIEAGKDESVTIVNSILSTMLVINYVKLVIKFRSCLPQGHCFTCEMALIYSIKNISNYNGLYCNHVTR